MSFSFCFSTKHFKLFVVILCVWSCIYVVLMMMMSNHFDIHEAIEKFQFVVKRSWIDTYQQKLSSDIYLPNNANNDRKIFFIHIPRTTADSIRTDLIGKNSEWLLDYSSWRTSCVPFDIHAYDKHIYGQMVAESAKNNSNYSRCFQNVYANRHRTDTHKYSNSTYCLWSERKIQVIKGFLSYSVVDQYRGIGYESKQLVTILRHPCDRIYSFYQLLTYYGHSKSETTKCNFLKMFDISEYRCNISFYDFLQMDNTRLQAMTREYMTWQLSSSVDLTEHRQYLNETANQMQFEIAKYNLRHHFHFIGFYEDMFNDFDRLHKTVFADVENTFQSRLVFNIGTFFSLPRMRTLKYCAYNMNEKERRLVYDINKYDIMLYEYAKQLMNKTFSVYKSYRHYLRDWLPVI